MKAHLWLAASVLALCASPVMAAEASSESTTTLVTATENTSVSTDNESTDTTTSSSAATEHTTTSTHKKEDRGLLTSDVTGNIHFASGTTPPSSITVTMTTSSGKKFFVTTDASKGWKYTFKNVLNTDAKTATFSLSSSLNKNYTITQSGHDFTLTAIPKETLTYKIVFQNKGTNVFPRNPKVTLKTADGQKVSALPQLSIDGNTYTYTYKVNKGSYVATPSVDNASQYTLTKTPTTFTYTVKTKKVTGNVVFKDSTTDVRPKKGVLVNVWNGKNLVATPTATANNQYRFTTKDLPAVDANGNPISYRVSGVTLPFYQKPTVSGTTITYQAQWWKVPVEKYDKNDPSKKLTGGLLTIKNASTGKTILPVNGTLPVGQTYTIQTAIAPFGYKKPTNKVTFRLLDDGTLQQKEGNQWKTVKSIRLPYEKVPAITLGSGSTTGGSSTGGLTGLPSGNLPHLPKLSDLLSNLGSKLHLPSLKLPNFLDKLGNTFDLGRSSDGLGSGFASSKGLDLPSLSSGSSTKSNGGLGNFEDLFGSSHEDIKGNLPQTGNDKQYGLATIGALLIAAILTFVVYRFIKRRKAS